MQMKRVLVILAVAALVSSVAVAEVRSTDETARNGISSVRTNGTLGSFTGSIVQTGPLQVNWGATITTAGGDGAPLVTTIGTQVYTLNDQIRLFVQLYDSPWSLHTFSTSTGQYFINSPTALGSFTSSYAATVPRAANYQVWAAALAGHSWPTAGFNWFDFTQGIYTSPGGGRFYSIYDGPMATTYVDATQPPTPTPSGAGEPVPALSGFGILAMIAILAGVAILVMYGRK